MPLGDAFLVVWTDVARGDVYAVRVDRDGNRLDADPLVIASSPDREAQARVASDGKQALVVWQRTPSSDEDHPTIEGRFVAADGTLGASVIPLVTRGAWSTAPAVASSGKSFFVVWSSVPEVPSAGQDAAWDLRSIRVDGTGKVLDAEYRPVALGVGGTRAAGVAPTVTFGGGLYAVTWTQDVAGGHDAYGAWVLPSGRVRAPAGSLTGGATDVTSVRIACDDDCLVGWTRAAGSELRRFDALGRPIGDAAKNGVDGQSIAAMAFDGKHFVVVSSRPGTTADHATAALSFVDTTADDAGAAMAIAPSALDADAIASAGLAVAADAYGNAILVGARAEDHRLQGWLAQDASYHPKPPPPAVAADAGPDGDTDASDAAPPDAAPPPDRDGAVPVDGTPDASDAGEPTHAGGGTAGCSAAATRASSTSTGALAAAFAIVLGAIARRRRRAA